MWSLYGHRVVTPQSDCVVHCVVHCVGTVWTLCVVTPLPGVAFVFTHLDFARSAASPLGLAIGARRVANHAAAPVS
jgi:hypothetical protein